MPLFVCDKCDSIENTALGDFWANRYEKNPVLCSECSKGKWHGQFPKDSANEYLIVEEIGLSHFIYLGPKFDYLKEKK